MRIALLWFAVALSFLTSPPSFSATGSGMSDPRMDQLITLQSTGERLHSVVEQLSNMSGVAICCGSNANDWRVRDIPIVVCAKDLPLGTLLQAMADSTHLVLETQSTDGELGYYLKRSAETNKELREYPGKCRQTALALAAWNWDVASKCKSVPERAFAHIPDWRKVIELFPEVFSILGMDARDSVLSGKDICLCTGNAPAKLQPVLQRVFDAFCEVEAKSASSTPDPSKCFLRIYLGEAEIPSLRISVGTANHYVMEYIISLLALSVHEANPIAFPKLAEVTNSGPGVPLFDPPSSQSQPPLSETIELGESQGNGYLPYAEAFRRLSEKCNISIVAEDFISHRSNGGSMLIPGKPAALHNILARTYSDFSWEVNKEHRLLTGRSRRWRTAHNNLVPETMIDGLASKLHGQAPSLDDTVALSCLTRTQLDDWVYNNKKLNVSKWPRPHALLSLYCAIPAEDRQKAWTTQGCPLTGMDDELIRRAWDESGVDGMICPCANDPSAKKSFALDLSRKDRLAIRLSKLPPDAKSHGCTIEMIDSQTGESLTNISLGQVPVLPDTR